MSDRRKKDVNWLLNSNADGSVTTSDAQLAVLMDIRDALTQLNRLLNCPNMLAMPQLLRRIAANTTPRQKQRHEPGSGA